MAATLPADQISYEDLYTRWEHGNWSATGIDFSTDREHWSERFSDIDRRAALWTYSMFFHGEDSVADNLSPYIDAAPRAEQKYFLATQQADEARHAVLFARFMREVADAGSDTKSALEATRPDPEITALLFDGLRRQLDTSLAPGARIQWEFDDAEPWHVTVQNGTASAAPGRLEAPDLTLRSRFQDWVDVTAGRADPVRAVITRRIRPSGRLRMLIRVPKLFV